ncbi:hypothetical protein EDB83DRAFT_2680385 [Lactarius deliciosus]|nr:hypothetical protein EDB83DRAFT_2680385 [Lactarius deliciosus]
MARTDKESGVATINILPDDIFREIFAICLSDPDEHPVVCMWEWQGLVRVCQRWRQIICASPRYFDLHLCCTNGTPFRESLSLWPEFPLIVEYYAAEDDDELNAALEHPDRVRRIDLSIASSEVFEAVEAMNVPFPVLTHLELTGHKEELRPKDMLYLSDRFLGGSAPCLQHLSLESAALDDLPKLLLSARDLVSLRLEDFPPWGCISPEEIVGGLAGLTRLRTLSIRFTFPYERWSSPMPPQPCAVLPALTEFEFRGDSKYLDELMGQIDTPRVEDVRIEYSELDHDVQAPQFSEFIKRAQFRHARVDFSTYDPDIKLDCPQGECHQAHFSLIIPGTGFQEFTTPDVLGQLVPMLSNVVHLSILGEDSMDDVLPLLRLFPAVEAMDVDRNAAGYIASALEDIAEDKVTEVLPVLELLLLDGDDNKLEGFLSLRRLSGRPVTIVNTQDEFVARLNASSSWDKVLQLPNLSLCSGVI